MEYLKKAEGIDVSAQGSELHGSVTIQLKDKTTDKVIEEVKHDNFFTQALDSLINGCPYGLTSMPISYIQGHSDMIRGQDIILGNITDKLLSGILLFPTSLGNSTSNLYADLNIIPTGMASTASYELTLPQQGTCSLANTGAISNGYKYTYEWGTAYGNGTIASVALSHKNCYKYFYDQKLSYFPYDSRDNQCVGWNRIINPNNIGRAGVKAISPNGILFCGGSANTSWDRGYPLFFVKMKPYSFELNNILQISEVSANASWSFDFSSLGHGLNSATIQYYDGKFICLQRDLGTNKTCYITYFSENDGSILSETTRTWNTSIDLSYAGIGWAIKDGYVYIGARTEGKVYKCSLTDDNDVTAIENAIFTGNMRIHTHEFTDDIYIGGLGIYNNGTFIPSENRSAISLNCAYSATGGYFPNAPYYENGVWIVTDGAAASNICGMGAIFKTPYLATKNNLDTPVVKTTDTTMKVTYTITQQ